MQDLSHKNFQTRAVHASERVRIGIAAGLVRLSTGFESPEDILAYLESALSNA